MRKKSEIMKIIGSTLMGITIGGIVVNKLNNKVFEKKGNKTDKFKQYYNLLNQWLALKNEGKSLEQYFINNNYQEIAIYGMGELGCRLYEELKDTSIIVKYVIDKDAYNMNTKLNIVTPDDEFQKVSVIIVSAIFAFDDIKEELEKKVNCPIISLEEVVYEL